MVVAEPSVENGFITPTFKVKRNRIEEGNGPLFDRWTSVRTPVACHAALSAGDAAVARSSRAPSATTRAYLTRMRL